MPILAAHLTNYVCSQSLPNVPISLPVTPTPCRSWVGGCLPTQLVPSVFDESRSARHCVPAASTYFQRLGRTRLGYRHARLLLRRSSRGNQRPGRPSGRRNCPRFAHRGITRRGLPANPIQHVLRRLTGALMCSVLRSPTTGAPSPPTPVPSRPWIRTTLVPSGPPSTPPSAKPTRAPLFPTPLPTLQARMTFVPAMAPTAPPVFTRTPTRFLNRFDTSPPTTWAQRDLMCVLETACSKLQRLRRYCNLDCNMQHDSTSPAADRIA